MACESEEQGDEQSDISGSQRRHRIDLTNSVTFVDPVAASQYRCGICLETIKDAVSLCDDHIFCFKCAEGLHLNNSYLVTRMTGTMHVVQCPICRKEASVLMTKPLKFIDRQIRQLTVKCPNHEITTQRALSLQWNDHRTGDDNRVRRNEHQKRGQNPNHNLHSNRNGRGWRPSRRSISIISRSKSLSLSRSMGSRARSRSRSREREERRAQSESGIVSKWSTLTLDATPSIQSQPELELCPWTGPYDALQSHIEECPLHTVQCDHCLELMVRKDADDHVVVCSGRAPCDHCGVKVLKGQRAIHLQYCPEVEVECSWNTYGCMAMFKRKDEEEHMTGNMQAHLDMVKGELSYLNDCEWNHAQWKEKMAKKMRRMKERIIRLEMKMELDSTDSEGGDENEGNEDEDEDGGSEGARHALRENNNISICIQDT